MVSWPFLWCVEIHRAGGRAMNNGHRCTPWAEIVEVIQPPVCDAMIFPPALRVQRRPFRQEARSKLLGLWKQVIPEIATFTSVTRWWFQIFFMFTPIWGRFPIWLIFFEGVETTNQVMMKIPAMPWISSNLRPSRAVAQQMDWLSHPPWQWQCSSQQSCRPVSIACYAGSGQHINRSSTLNSMCSALMWKSVALLVRCFLAPSRPLQESNIFHRMHLVTAKLTMVKVLKSSTWSVHPLLPTLPAQPAQLAAYPAWEQHQWTLQVPLNKLERQPQQPPQAPVTLQVPLAQFPRVWDHKLVVIVMLFQQCQGMEVPVHCLALVCHLSFPSAIVVSSLDPKLMDVDQMMVLHVGVDVVVIIAPGPAVIAWRKPSSVHQCLRVFKNGSWDWLCSCFCRTCTLENTFQEGQITGSKSTSLYNLVLSIQSFIFQWSIRLELIMCIDQFGRPFSPETPALGQRIGKQ